MSTTETYRIDSLNDRIGMYWAATNERIDACTGESPQTEMRRPSKSTRCTDGSTLWAPVTATRSTVNQRLWS